VIDPSGAGDAFASGLITGIAKGWAFPQSLQYASLLGASATWMIGTTDGVLTGAQAERTMAEEPVTIHKVSEEHLIRGNKENEGTEFQERFWP
jgi:fructose-1-phosphate kinase PfkB-like protein